MVNHRTKSATAKKNSYVNCIARTYLLQNDCILSYPLVNKQFAIENGPVEIVDLPINSMVVFHRCLLTFTGPGISHIIHYNPLLSQITMIIHDDTMVWHYTMVYPMIFPWNVPILLPKPPLTLGDPTHIIVGWEKIPTVSRCPPKTPIEGHWIPVKSP